MNCLYQLVFLLTICLNIKKGVTHPDECYTCQSKPDEDICGEGFAMPAFRTKFCNTGHFYCLKVIETTGGSTMVYRRCSKVNCEEEIKRRYGTINYCGVCTRTLCNRSTIGSTLSPLIYLLMIAVLFYQLNN